MATAVDAGQVADQCGLESPGLVSDCRLMLSFARRNAFVLPPPLVREVAWLDSVLRALEITTVSQMAPGLVWPNMNGAPAAKVRTLLAGVRDEVSKPTRF
jgi:hypothetical protein